MNQARRLKVLLLGYRPPPYFGPSVTYQALMRSAFPQQLDVTFIDLTVVESLEELETLHWHKIWKSLRFLGQELWCLLTQRFDFVCAPVSVNRNAFLKDAFLLWLARLFRVPTVLYAHGNNLPDFFVLSPPWLRRIMDRTFRRAAGVIVLGERLRFNFDSWLPPERVFVVPTGIEPSPAPPSAQRVPGGCTVLYLGNMVREKGFFVLLEAANIIARQRRDIRFVFGGAWRRADEERAAREFAADNGISDLVEFLGPVVGEAKTRSLANADLLAFPTFYYYETMGLVLLEAMQAGLSVVTTRRASIPEIIQDGINGLLVEEQNAADLAAKILRLADDPALRKRMGQANRERFQNYYTHEQYGQRMAEVFTKLAAMK